MYLWSISFKFNLFSCRANPDCERKEHWEDLSCHDLIRRARCCHAEDFSVSTAVSPKRNRLPWMGQPVERVERRTFRIEAGHPALRIRHCIVPDALRTCPSGRGNNRRLIANEIPARHGETEEQHSSRILIPCHQ